MTKENKEINHDLDLQHLQHLTSEELFETDKGELFEINSKNYSVNDFNCWFKFRETNLEGKKVDSMDNYENFKNRFQEYLKSRTQRISLDELIKTDFFKNLSIRHRKMIISIAKEIDEHDCNEELLQAIDNHTKDLDNYCKLRKKSNIRKNAFLEELCCILFDLIENETETNISKIVNKIEKFIKNIIISETYYATSFKTDIKVINTKRNAEQIKKEISKRN